MLSIISCFLAICIPSSVNTSFYCTSQTLHFFCTLKSCGYSALSKLVTTIFSTFAHLMFLCYILAILTTLQTFSLFYVLWWSVISDLWCYYHKKIMSSWKLRWQLAFFSSEIFFNSGMCIIFLDVIQLCT